MKNNFYKINALNGVEFYKNKLLEESKLVNHGFSTKIGGVSKNAYSSLNLGINTDDLDLNVRNNFYLFTEAIGTKLESLVLSDQVHSDKIHTVEYKDCGKGIIYNSDIKGVDALITNKRNVALATFYADCTPILMLDTVKKVIASVHSGWRGTLLRISQKTVNKMVKEYDSDPKNIICVIGPSIKSCHFEVGKEVFDEFKDVFGEEAILNSYFKNDKYYINTDALNVISLKKAGIVDENISVCPLCTYCNNNLFFSHRADKGKTGRMCAVIELK